MLVANKRTVPVLKSRLDFMKIRNNGFSIGVNKWLLLSYVRNDKAVLRVGWTFPTYIGGSVVRNRYKRWVREDLRNLSEKTKNTPVDVNILLRRRDGDFYCNVTREVFDAALFEAFRKIESKVA